MRNIISINNGEERRERLKKKRNEIEKNLICDKERVRVLAFEKRIFEEERRKQRCGKTGGRPNTLQGKNGTDGEVQGGSGKNVTTKERGVNGGVWGEDRSRYCCYFYCYW